MKEGSIPGGYDNLANELICGRNAVAELLKSGRTVDTVYISSEDGKRLSYIASLAKSRGAVVKNVPRYKLDKMCRGEKHQGVAAYASETEYRDVSDMLELARSRGEDPFIVITDGIEDPHNLGAIIRTAECAGAHGVVFPKRGGTTITEAVQKASAGAASTIMLARVANIPETIRRLKEEGLFVYCADMDGTYCADVDMTGPCAVVVGSEGRGVSRLAKEVSDETVSLPIKGSVNSLNASVAAGAVIYEIVRQRINRFRGKQQ